MSQNYLERKPGKGAYVVYKDNRDNGISIVETGNILFIRCVSEKRQARNKSILKRDIFNPFILKGDENIAAQNDYYCIYKEFGKEILTN